MLHYALHTFIIFFGTPANVLAILVIATRTPKAMQEYAVLLLYTSICELLSIFTHVLLNPRLFLTSSSAFCIADGLCRLISDQFCGLAADFMHVVMSHSTAIVAVCFWYRTRILTEKGAIGAWSLQALLAAVFAPHALHIAGFSYTINSREDLVDIVEEVYERGYSSVYALQGYARIHEPAPAFFIGYLVIVPMCAPLYIICARRKLVAIMAQKRQHMSNVTRHTHESTVKVLTIHAIIPIAAVFCVSLLAVAQVAFNKHSENIEGLGYDISAIPTVTNPILTLCFVRPYRMALHLLFSRESRRAQSITVHKTESRQTSSLHQYNAENCINTF